MSSGEPEEEPRRPAGAKARAKAKATPRAKAKASVASAAAELQAHTGAQLPTADSHPDFVPGPLPPLPSSNGKVYFAVRGVDELPAVVCSGQKACLEHIGGSWLGHSFGPIYGFRSLESAINFAQGRFALPGKRIEVTW